jgi:plastocyanin
MPARRTPYRRLRALLGVALAALAGILAGAGCLGGEARPPGASPSPTGLLERRDFGGRTADVHGTLRIDTSNATVQMEDRYFEPTVLTGSPGLRVTLMVRNEGTQLHNFTLTSQEIAQDVPPGSIVAIPVELPSSGEAVFFCRFHRDTAGMLGALVAS